MAEEKRRKSGGAKLSRSQTVTVRLDPQLRYMADIAARSQRRTLSSYVEWAIHQSLDDVVVKSDSGASRKASKLVDDLWDVDEPDRFVLLALFNHDLLTHEEQILWKLIGETKALWSTTPENESEPFGSIGGRYLRVTKLRSSWKELKATAHGD